MPNKQIQSLTVEGVTYDIVDNTSGYINAQYIENKTDYSIPVSRAGEIIAGETAIGTDSTNFPTSKAVVDYVDERVVQEIDAIDVGVSSVNGKTGSVTLSASDVGAASSSDLEGFVVSYLEDEETGDSSGITHETPGRICLSSYDYDGADTEASITLNDGTISIESGSNLVINPYDTYNQKVTINGVVTPTSNYMAANKAYVDRIARTYYATCSSIDSNKHVLVFADGNVTISDLKKQGVKICILYTIEAPLVTQIVLCKDDKFNNFGNVFNNNITDAFLSYHAKIGDVIELVNTNSDGSNGYFLPIGLVNQRYDYINIGEFNATHSGTFMDPYILTIKTFCMETTYLPIGTTILVRLTKTHVASLLYFNININSDSPRSKVQLTKTLQSGDFLLIRFTGEIDSDGCRVWEQLLSSRAMDEIPTTISSFTNDAGYLTSSDIASVLKYKGTKASYSALPSSGNVTGDVWHLTDTGAEWAWDGSAWQELGTAIDLSNYATKATTLSGYGITDAKIQNGTITLGSNTITPLTSYTETDPTVPSWAKQSTKPSYALSEITSADDIKAIEALTGTSGLLRKTAANTWSLDTNTYLTSYTETDPVFSASAAAGIDSNDINSWNNLEKYSNVLSLYSEKTHEGLRCWTTITCPSDMFMALVTQYDTLEDDQKYYLRFIIHIPSEYKTKYAVRRINALKVSSDFELTDETATGEGVILAKGSTNINYNYLLRVNTAEYVNGDFSHLRCAIDLYNDNDEVIRTLYSSQVTIAKNNDTLSAINKYYESPEDIITYGFLAFTGNINGFMGSEFSSLNYINNHTNDSFHYGATGSADAAIAPYGFSRLIPWSTFEGENRAVTPVLRIGANKCIIGTRSSSMLPSFITETAITDGSTFCLDGLWYKATQNLAAGTTLVLGTNCIAVTQPTFLVYDGTVV